MITTLFEAFGDIEKTMEENATQQAGDYVGENGLLYCGICNTPKQARTPDNHFTRSIGKAGHIVPCMCRCAGEKYEREIEELRNIQKREEIARKRRDGFPDWELSKFTFSNDDGKTPRISEAMKKYCFNFEKFKADGKGLLLYGSVETGKTYIACAVANELIDKGYSCLCTNFSRIEKSLWNIEDKQKYFDELNRYDLLVIDDLGAERKSDYMKEIVFNVIDSRDRVGLPMILTTNLSLEDLKNPKDIEDERIYSRILKSCFPVEVEGVKRRREIVKRDYGEMKDILGL